MTLHLEAVDVATISQSGYANRREWSYHLVRACDWQPICDADFDDRALTSNTGEPQELAYAATQAVTCPACLVMLDELMAGLDMTDT